jgi:predicted nucleic acid-binding protein
VRVYIDTSALLKRAIAEQESSALRSALVAHADAQDAVVSSTLAWIEVSRALRTRLSAEPIKRVTTAGEIALSGVAEWPIGTEVVGLARRISPQILRSLDAIHLATAVLVDAQLMITYDDRLADAAREHGIEVIAPA